jgi:NAD(P)-dependent dehydrogenase (short-subunit alcohol dehydrogenase family)
MKRNNFNLSLKNKKILITGAAGSLGKAISQCLLELGAKVYLVDIKDYSSSKHFKNLKSIYSKNVYFFQCDITNEQSVNVLIKNFLKIKSLDVLINNAAFTGSSKLIGWNTSFENQKKEGWQKSLELNLSSIFDLIQKLLPLLKKSNQGNIINISSIYGSTAPDWNMYKDTSIYNPAAYSASKAGLINLTKWLAVTLSPSIRVNSVSPGGIKRNQSSKFIKNYEKKTPLKRMAKEEDIIGTIAFLSSDLSSYINGQDIRVDGGFGLN